MDARRLILGDWTPLVRDGIDVLRIGLVVATLVALVAGNVGGALALGFATVLALLARIINLPRPYDAGFVLVLTLHAVGEALGWYDSISWFDRVVHVVLPCLVAPVLYIGLARLDVLPDPRDETHARHYTGMAIVVFCLGMAVGGLWEIVEFTSDGTFDTALSEGNSDTVGDLVADAVGSLLGALLLVAWAVWGWGSVRRITGVNTYEDADA
ncbi:hypothetical protein CLV56_3924 [Mumia flava]|uniref:DUF2238 domain-containing protein n=1 Tax=Mumia flava TaxID=1348852 RepID=A0A0B2BFD3_9ACTN|nr:hypothetical protein [Mumia flava]PJJ48220.1 hypothetical protein CLV56_3924 [Mumia flava]